MISLGNLKVKVGRQCFMFIRWATSIVEVYCHGRRFGGTFGSADSKRMKTRQDNKRNCLESKAGGEFWPTVQYYTIFALVFMHTIVIGIFGLKKLPIAFALTLPLPILTLLLNEYWQK
ncbi:hypothetical protein JHK82_025071 [Glycine max]|nr:hypothetical protein JHK82_025071 [Glycine max]